MKRVGNRVRAGSGVKKEMDMDIVEIVMAALDGPVFRLADRMEGETVTAWKNRRKLDRMWANKRKAQAAGSVGSGRKVEGAAGGILLRGVQTGILTARDVAAAERIYRLGRMARMCGGAMTSFYGERVGTGDADYEAGVAAELAYRGVMGDMPWPACREFIRRVIVDGEGMEAAVVKCMPSGLKTKQNRLGGAWVMLQAGLSSAVEHFDAVGWR